MNDYKYCWGRGREEREGFLLSAMPSTTVKMTSRVPPMGGAVLLSAAAAMAEASAAGHRAPPGASAESCARYDDDGGDGDGDESEAGRSEDCSGGEGRKRKRRRKEVKGKKVVRSLGFDLDQSFSSLPPSFLESNADGDVGADLVFVRVCDLFRLRRPRAISAGRAIGTGEWCTAASA